MRRGLGDLDPWGYAWCQCQRAAEQHAHVPGSGGLIIVKPARRARRALRILGVAAFVLAVALAFLLAILAAGTVPPGG